MEHNIPITPLSDMSWLGITWDLWNIAFIVAFIVALTLLISLIIGIDIPIPDFQNQVSVKLLKILGIIIIVAPTIVLVSGLYAVITITDSFGNQVSQIVFEQGIDTSQGCTKDGNEEQIQDCSNLFTHNGMKINFITVADNKHHEVFITENALLIGDNSED